VLLSGTNFGVTQGAGTVTFFNGVTATVNTWSDDQISLTVPVGAATGNVVVTAGGWASNGVSFTVTGNPYIEYVTPDVGAVGSTVMINGSSFGASQGSSTVTFNGVAATAISSWTGTQIELAVPSGAVTGNVVVTVGGVASNGYAFALGSTVYYYFADQLGTSRVMTDSNGTICFDADFYPFGGERDYTDNCTQNYKFTGKERDSESGLDNFGARYNSSQYGRFMTPDWSDDPSPVPWADLANPQSLNLYAYVDNNPLSHIDPNGHGCAPDTWNPSTNTLTAGACTPDLPAMGAAMAVGHHFIDQAIIKAEGAWNSLAGQFFRRWTTGGPLKNPGVHTGYPKPARLNTQQIQQIVDKVKAETGRDMSQWTKEDIAKAQEEVRNAGGDTGQFLKDIAEENPAMRTVQSDTQDIMNAAEKAFDAARSVAGEIGSGIAEGAEDIKEACDGGPGCMIP